MRSERSMLTESLITKTAAYLISRFFRLTCRQLDETRMFVRIQPYGILKGR